MLGSAQGLCMRAGFDLYRELYTFPAFLDFMPPISGMDVIDLGCGEGTNTRRFARMGGRMTGIDLSQAMIAYARAEFLSCPAGRPAADTTTLTDRSDPNCFAFWNDRVLQRSLAITHNHECFQTSSMQARSAEAHGPVIRALDT